MSTKNLRTTLWLSTIFNLVAALIFVMPQTAVGQLLGLPPSPNPIYMAMVVYFVALFGLSYGWLARQEEIVVPLLMMGVVGKLGVFILALILLISGDLSFLLFLVACIDLTFASLWLWWWRGQASN